MLGHGRRVLPFLGRMPNLVEEERSGEDSTWRGSEKRQEVELASRQFDKVPTHEHPPRIEINTKAAEVEGSTRVSRKPRTQLRGILPGR